MKHDTRAASPKINNLRRVVERTRTRDMRAIVISDLLQDPRIKDRPNVTAFLSRLDETCPSGQVVLPPYDLARYSSRRGR
jgi:hypothetical protein